MKNLFIVLVLACLLSSCTSDMVVTTMSLKEQKDLTTIEMQEHVKSDTVTYKIIEKDGGVYLVNPSTKLVEKQVKMETSTDTVPIILCIIALVFIIFL